MIDHSLHARFLSGLSAAPDGVALRIGARQVRYAELHELALRYAAAVPDRGTVGILAGKSLTAYAGLLGALYSGSTAVPLHPDFPAARTQHMLAAAGVTALIVDEAGARVLDGLDVRAPVVGPVPPTGSPLARPLRASADDVAYILFTSGSTGRPKGVPITHGNTHHYFAILDQRYDFGPRDVFSQTFDLNFDCAMFDLFCAWSVGASVHPVPPAGYRDLPAFIAERGMTVWFSTPSGISMARRLGALRPDTMPSLRWSFFAGEALRATDAQQWLRAAPGSTLENIYGPTELTVTISGHRWDPAVSPGRCVNGLVPIGTIHSGHPWLLVDAADRAVLEEGELCVAGPQRTPGYLDRTDGKGRFLHRDGHVYYRTGDRVRVVGGELVYLGRLDAQVQIQGWRVELSEVEHAVRGCPGVTDTVAVARTVNGETALVVYYTGAPTPPMELARAAAKVLPKGMLPRRYEHLAEFPLNANRKIDRGRLAALASP